MPNIMINTALNNSELPQVIENTTNWHYDKDIIENGIEERQLDKLLEEVHELRDAILLGESEDEIQKEAGDVITVLINICERRGYTLQGCLAKTYEKISKRKGKKINGTFVKQEDL